MPGVEKPIQARCGPIGQSPVTGSQTAGEFNRSDQRVRLLVTMARNTLRAAPLPNRPRTLELLDCEPGNVALEEPAHLGATKIVYRSANKPGSRGNWRASRLPPKGSPRSRPAASRARRWLRYAGSIARHLAHWLLSKNGLMPGMASRLASPRRFRAFSSSWRRTLRSSPGWIMTTTTGRSCSGRAGNRSGLT